jgi:hypothetical protein
MAHAQRALADLGTADAVRFMLTRARKDPRTFDALALFRSANRSVVIQELDTYLADPGVGWKAGRSPSARFLISSNAILNRWFH